MLPCHPLIVLAQTYEITGNWPLMKSLVNLSVLINCMAIPLCPYCLKISKTQILFSFLPVPFFCNSFAMQNIVNCSSPCVLCPTRLPHINNFHIRMFCRVEDEIRIVNRHVCFHIFYDDSIVVPILANLNHFVQF